MRRRAKNWQPSWIHQNQGSFPDYQPQTLSQPLLASWISFHDTYHKLIMGWTVSLAGALWPENEMNLLDSPLYTHCLRQCLTHWGLSKNVSLENWIKHYQDNRKTHRESQDTIMRFIWHSSSETKDEIVLQAFEICLFWYQNHLFPISSSMEENIWYVPPKHL